MVCPDIDPKLAAMGIFGMMNWVYQWYRSDGQSGPDVVGRTFANIVLGGLACLVVPRRQVAPEAPATPAAVPAASR